FAAAIAVTVLYAFFATASLTGAFEPDLTTTALAGAVIWSLVDHLMVAVLLFIVLGLVLRIARGTIVVQYGVLLAGAWAGLTIAVERVVCRAIGLDGASAAIAAGSLSLSIAATWSGFRLRRYALEDRPLSSAIDVLFGPVRSAGSGAGWLTLA